MHPPGFLRRAAPALAVLAVLAVAASGVAGCGDEGSGNVEAFCATARRFETDNPAAALTAVDPSDATGTARALRDAAGQLRTWAREAPSEVRADIEAVRDAAGDLAEAFEAPTVDQATVAALEASSAEVEAAGQRVVEAVREQCEVDLDPAVTTGG